MTDEEIYAAIKALEELMARLIALRNSNGDPTFKKANDPLDDIIERACKVFCKPIITVRSKRKTRDVTDVRWAFFRVAKQQGFRPAEIARKMNIHHGTVIHGCRRCQEHMDTNKHYAAKVRALEAACERNL